MQGLPLKLMAPVLTAENNRSCLPLALFLEMRPHSSLILASFRAGRSATRMPRLPAT
jgi:hypothetical protein